ncbi:olfactory receptor 4K3-like [Oryzias melastigma]|uniref:Olfactory receptor n=1 Tax=Oryzias melastigma TaxID=30732 RepID=A0A3B3DPB0_ORYME|nr:olfactory receptor 4K3-like [Oryzias melastigma]
MDNSNVTYITFTGFVDLQSYRLLYFVIMFTVYVSIIFGNLTIFCLICIHKSLHEPMYIFIAALLLNSLLFSTNIYPKLLIDFLSDQQIISLSLCQFQGFIYYTLSGAEFLLLSAMAYDRYVSICKPFQYASIMKKSTVSVLLVLSWVLPACQIIPSLFLTSSIKICNFNLNGVFCNNVISKLYCMGSSSAYVIYGVFLLLNNIFLPLIFIIFTYTKILLVSYRSSMNVRRKAAQTCSPHLLVLISFSCLCSYDIVIARLQVDLHKTARFIMTLQVVLYHPLFNPIIYGVKVKKISELLKRLFLQGKITLCFKIDV